MIASPSPWLLVLGVLPVGAGLLVQPRLTRALLADLRVARILHYAALGGLGMALGLHDRRAELFTAETVVRFALLVITLAYAAVFAIVTNNLADVGADRISNPDRPLVRGTVAPRPYLAAGIAAEIVALALAAAADVRLSVGIVVISLGYAAYSCPPLRLKRVPVVAKLIIGLNSLVAAVCGFALCGGDWRAFPPVWAAYVLGPVALAANFVDLKDTAGDRADGVATLPVLLGERCARAFIAAASVSGYVMAGWLLGLAWVWPLNAVMAILHVRFLYRQPYDERFVFAIYVPSLFALDVLLLLP